MNVRQGPQIGSDRLSALDKLQIPTRVIYCLFWIKRCQSCPSLEKCPGPNSGRRGRTMPLGLSGCSSSTDKHLDGQRWRRCIHPMSYFDSQTELNHSQVYHCGAHSFRFRPFRSLLGPLARGMRLIIDDALKR